MQAVVRLAVQDVAVGRVHRVGLGNGQRRDLVGVVQRGLAEGSHTRTDVERGQGARLREGLLTNSGHRIRQGHGGLAGAAESEVTDGDQPAQLWAVVDAQLGAAGLKGAALDRDGAAQVNGFQLARVAERAGSDRLEALGQGERGQRGEAEGLVADRAQRRGQGHGHQAGLRERPVRDLSGPIHHRVRSAGVLRRRVQDQARVVLGVQDAIHAVVERVVRIDLDAGQRAGLRVSRGHRFAGDLRAEGQCRQSPDVVDELGANRRDGTRQGQRLQGRVREGAITDRRQPRGGSLVVLEGDLLERGVDERLVADGAHTGGDRHVLHGRAGKCALADVGDALGDDDVGRASLVGGQHAAVVDHEVVGVGGTHSHGDLRGLSRAGLVRDGRTQRANTRVIAARQGRRRRLGSGHDGRQIGGFDAPGDLTASQRGSQVRLEGGLLPHLHGDGGLREFDARVLGDFTHVDRRGGRQSRLGSVGHGDRRVARGHSAHLAGRAHGRHGLVRGGPHQVGHVGVRRLVGGGQRDLLTGDNRGLGRGQRQRGHRDGLEADLLAGLVLAPVPGVQVGGRRVGRIRAVDQVRPLDLVVLGVGAVGRSVRAHGLLLVVVVARRGRLGERDTRQRRVIGDVEGDDARVALTGHGYVRNSGRLGVQRELPRQLLLGGGGRDRGGLDRQLVTTVGQLVAVLVEAVEDRVVALLALHGLHGARGEAEQGFLRALEGIGAHGVPGLVRVRVGQLRRVTQHARARKHLVGRFLGRGARHDEVGGIDRAHGHRILADQRVQGAQGHVRRRVHQGRGAGVRGAGLAVVPLAVEDCGRAPGTIEAHVGNRQVGSSVGAREGHGAVDEGALGRVRVRVRGEGRARGHGDGHGGARLGGHGHGLGGEGQVDALPCPVGGVLGEELALDDLGQRLAAERVGVGLGRYVRELHLEAPARRAVSQISLGARRVGSSHHGRVHVRGRGRDRVHLTCADATRRVVGAVVLIDVQQRVGGAHQEVGDDRRLLVGRQGGELRVLVEALAHERRDARNLRGRHGRTGHRSVFIAQDRCHNVAAGGRNLGLEGQVRGDAPRREVGDRGVVRGQLEARVRVRDGDGVRVGGVDGLDQRVLLLLRDGHGGQRVRGLDGRHVGGVRLVSVADDEGGGRRAQLGQRADLGLVRHVRAGRAVRSAAVLQDDDVGQVTGVLRNHRLQGCRVADSAVDNGVGALRDVQQAGHESILESAGLAVDNLLVTVGQVGQGVLVVDRGNGQGRAVGSGFGDRARVGVGRIGLALTRVVREGARVGVASGGVDGHAGCCEVVVHLGVDGSSLGTHARIVTEREIDRVGPEDDRVVEGRQHGAVRDCPVLVGGDLGHDDLGVGRGALQVGRVGGRNGGDVRAVGQVLGGGGQHVGVVVGVVEDEGDLRVDVGTGLAVAQLAGEDLDVVLRQAHRYVVHGPGEGLVGGLDTRVDDLDDLVVALLRGLVRAGHLKGGPVLQLGVHGVHTGHASVAVDDHRLVVAFNEGGLDALGALDGLERGGGCLNREAIEGVGVVTHVRDGGTGELSLDRGRDAVLDGLVLGGEGMAEGALRPGHSRVRSLHLDDKRGRGVVGRLGGGARAVFPGLVGAVGGCGGCRLRVGGRGLGVLGPLRRALRGGAGLRLVLIIGSKGCRNTDCGRCEGAGYYQRQRRD